MMNLARLLVVEAPVEPVRVRFDVGASPTACQ